MPEPEDRALKIRNWALRAVRSMVINLHPDGDIDPWLLMLTPCNPVSAKLNRLQFEEGSGLATVCSTIIPATIHQHMGDAVALITGAWKLGPVQTPAGTHDLWAACPYQPDALVIQCITQTTMEYLIAPIEKLHDRLNKLGEFTLIAGAMSPGAHDLQRCLKRLLN